MKTITTFLFLCFASLFVHGQTQLELSIKKASDAISSVSEHLHLMEIKNLGRSTSDFNVAMVNKECQYIETTQQSILKNQLLDVNKNPIDHISVTPGESVVFYIKLTRPFNTRLNTWNCTEIYAIDQNEKPISNSVTIETLIPDPRNNN